MADAIHQIHQTREGLRRTITRCTTRLQEQDQQVRGFHTTAVARSSSLAMAIKEAEQALEQLKEDHDRAAANSSVSSVDQRRLASRAESVKAQAEATAALRAEVDALKNRADRGDEGAVTEEAGPEVKSSLIPPIDMRV